MLRTGFDVVATASRIGGQALRINPLRTVLSTLGVIIGVASLVAVLSLGDGMERSARSRLETTTGLQSIVVSSRTVEQIDADFFPLPDTLRLTPAEARAIRNLPGVSAVRMFAEGRRELRAGTVRRMVTVTAVESSPDTVPLAAGRGLRASDDSAHVSHAVASYDLALKLGGGDAERALGTLVAIGRDSAQVIGVLARSAGTPQPTLVVPFAQATQLLGERGIGFPRFDVRVGRIEDVRPVESAIGQLLARRTPLWKSRFEIATYRARAEQVAQGILIFKLLMGAITGISLIVGGIGIMNVLLASVSERTREIGIRRATGATRRDILFQFLAESVAISGLGSGAGIALGLAAAFGITAAIRRFAAAEFVLASFTWSSVAAAALASLVVGLAFGTYPARRAAGLSPVDAMRHE
jgi:putative ABC transport system permease protein